MKLTPDTLLILKNFSSINTNLLVKPGQVLQTISGSKSMIATASVVEDFPSEFGIFDLNTFLGAINLFKDPDFTFGDKFVDIKESGTRSKARYFLADGSMLTHPYDLNKTKIVTALKEAEISFPLSEDDLGRIDKACASFNSPEVVVESDGNEIVMSARDTKIATANSYSISLGDGNGSKFQMIYKKDHLKLLRGNYDVAISSKGISHFKNVDIPLEYYISLESTSEYRK